MRSFFIILLNHQSSVEQSEVVSIPSEGSTAVSFSAAFCASLAETPPYEFLLSLFSNSGTIKSPSMFKHSNELLLREVSVGRWSCFPSLVLWFSCSLCFDPSGNVLLRWICFSFLLGKLLFLRSFPSLKARVTVTLSPGCMTVPFMTLFSWYLSPISLSSPRCYYPSKTNYVNLPKRRLHVDFFANYRPMTNFLILQQFHVGLNSYICTNDSAKMSKLCSADK